MHNYLKYWRVVRYFIKAKYGLSQADLDVLLFLSSEKYFSKNDFDEFDELLSWDKNRFEDLRTKGWIEVFRKRTGKNKAIYQLSMQLLQLQELHQQDRRSSWSLPETKTLMELKWMNLRKSKIESGQS